MNWFKRIKIAGWLDSAANNIAKHIFDTLKRIESTEDITLSITNPLDGIDSIYIYISHREPSQNDSNDIGISADTRMTPKMDSKIIKVLLFSKYLFNC